MLTIFAYGGGGVPINAEIKFCNKTHGTQHSQSVLIKTLWCVADCPYQFVLYVLLPIVGVYNVSFSVIECDSVDGEVATGKIFKQGSTELHCIRSAFVRIS